MAIITGDRYLNLLTQFVEKQTGSLLDGSLVLKLNPVGLHYVQTRLDALYELERLRAGAPVDYLRAYVSDLGDHRVLEQLSRILSLLPAVKVVSALSSSSGRDPCPLTLSPFLKLRSLELRGCDLSTSPARGLLQLQPILEKLICHDSADALRHIFAERIQEVQKSQGWTRLSFVSCATNGMVIMDESLQLLPAVEFLDLSRNRFAKIANLHRCAKLRHLDLGFNQLRNITSLKQITSQLTKLVLKNNALVSLHGIAALTSLEEIDLSNNLIASFKEIQSVATIPSLQTFWLIGNPVSSCKFYREEVFSFFPDPTKVYLDGRKVLMSELWRVKRFISSRQKHKAVYGSYTPAEVPQRAYDAGNYDSRTKLSRLALIDDSQLQSNEVEDNESSVLPVSGNSSIDVKEKKQDISDENDQHKLEVIQLMQRAEALKMEKSIYWLQELRILFDNNELPSGQDQSKNELENESEKFRDVNFEQMRNFGSWKRKNGTSKAVSNADNFSEDLEMQREHDKHLENQKLSSIPSKDVNETESGTYSPLINPNTSTVSTLGSDLYNSTGVVETLGMRKVDDAMNVADDEDLNNMDGRFGSWRFIYDVVESQATQNRRASPPHYHKDILQKRQDLEDELFRFSLDPGYASSSSESESHSDARFTIVSCSSSENEDDYKDYPNIWQYQPSISYKVENGAVNRGMEEVAIADFQISLPSLDGNNITNARPSETPHANPLNPVCTNDTSAKSGGRQSMLNSEIITAKRRQIKLRKPWTAALYEPEVVEHPKIAEGEICGTLLNDNIFGSSSNSDNPVEVFFNRKISNSDEGEICTRLIKCGCIRLWEESPKERDIHLLLSSTEKLYMLMESHPRSAKHSKYSDHGFHVIASHRLQELRKVTVGLGLQAVRFDIGHAASYLFMTRDVCISREIFEMLRELEGSSILPDLESWEHTQLTLLEKLVLGSMKSNLLMYFLAFFCTGGSAETSQVTRAIVLVSHYIFVCIEDLAHFGESPAYLAALQQPYFIVEAVGDVYDLLQIGIFPDGGIWMEFKKTVLQLVDKQVGKRDAEPTVWKLTDLRDETAVKLVSLIHSIHPAGITPSQIGSSASVL